MEEYTCDKCNKDSIKYIIQHRLKLPRGCIKCDLQEYGYNYYEYNGYYLLLRDIWEWNEKIRNTYYKEQKIIKLVNCESEWPSLPPANEQR